MNVIRFFFFFNFHKKKYSVKYDNFKITLNDEYVGRKCLKKVNNQTSSLE